MPTNLACQHNFITMFYPDAAETMAAGRRAGYSPSNLSEAFSRAS